MSGRVINRICLERANKRLEDLRSLEIPRGNGLTKCQDALYFSLKVDVASLRRKEKAGGGQVDEPFIEGDASCDTKLTWGFVNEVTSPRELN